MNAVLVQLQIRSLETQLRVLKAQVSAAGECSEERKRFADLYGILRGKSDSSEEEIRAAEYRFDWENDHER